MTDAQMNAISGDIATYSAAFPAGVSCAIYLGQIAQIERKSAPGNYCNAIVHEFGNLAGYAETTEDGVTDKWIIGVNLWDCQHWKRWRRLHWR